jgi:hypothetical protein
VGNVWSKLAGAVRVPELKGVLVAPPPPPPPPYLGLVGLELLEHPVASMAMARRPANPTTTMNRRFFMASSSNRPP